MSPGVVLIGFMLVGGMIIGAVMTEKHLAERRRRVLEAHKNGNQNGADPDAPIRPTRVPVHYDYRRLGWGHDIVFYPEDETKHDRGAMVGWGPIGPPLGSQEPRRLTLGGRRIEAGDFLLMAAYGNDGNSVVVRFRVDTITYSNNPPDMWEAKVVRDFTSPPLFIL